MIQLILSGTELNFGLIILITMKDLNLIIFMIMTTTMKDWFILFEVQRKITRLESLKKITYTQMYMSQKSIKMFINEVYSKLPK